MKSITLKSTSALALALVAGGLMTTTVSAAPVANETSEGKIAFQAGTFSIVDPENDPNSPNYDAGAAQKPAVPSFDFGTQTVNTAAKIYNVVTAGSLKVTDGRGTLVGWKVTVEQDAQLSNGTDELTGAQLKLNNATSSSTDGITVTNPGVLAPGAGPVKVYDAAVGKGGGEYSLTWADNSTDAQLEVPGGVAKQGTPYTAQLTWTLEDSPA